MALWVCRYCSTKFAVGLSMCPQCTGTDVYEDGRQEDEMPKITVHGGPSNAAAEGGDKWPGTSSSTSSEKEPTTDETNAPDDQSPAPTTENPSETDPTANSSAPSTDGGTTAASRRPAKKASPKKRGS